MKKLTIAFMTLSLISLSGVAYSFGGKSGAKDGKFREVLKQLDLSQEQMESLKEYKKVSKTKERSDRKEMKQLKEDIKVAFINGASDEKLKELNSKIEVEHEKMKEARFNKMLFMKNILNEEQRKKFMDMKKEKKHSED